MNEIDILKFGLQIAISVPVAYIVLGAIVIAGFKLIALNIRTGNRRDKKDKKEE